MVDAFAKDYLHSDLRDVRAAMVWKLEGLSEYDARRPLTATGTNLLGLITVRCVPPAPVMVDGFRCSRSVDVGLVQAEECRM